MKRLLALLMPLPCLALALDFEVGLGVSQFQYAHDGSTWYQDPLPHTLKLSSPSLSVGVSDVYSFPKNWGDVRWHIGYQYLGKVTSQAIATTGPDFDFKNFPTAHFNGSGEVQGFYAAAEYEHQVGAITWGFGPGIYLYRSTWCENIADWRGSFTAPITPLNVCHQPKWQNTPTMALTARHGQHSMVLTYLHHVTAEGDIYPALYDVYRAGTLGKLGLPGMFNLSYRYSF